MMNSRTTLLLLLLSCSWAPAQVSRSEPPPNVIFMLADDLGYGELGCYGQTKIKTPALDRLAAEGLRFTQHYAGAPVCAPSRCVLMTGMHPAHAFIRGNKEVKPEGQWPIPDETVTLAEVMRLLGYRTGCIGKWGLGPPGSTGDPMRQGFDLFFGYNCQRQAHTYFPGHLWFNGQRFLLDNPRVPGHTRLKEPPESYARWYGNQYAPDLMLSMALAFIRRNKDRPFCLYLPFVQPHLAMQPPQWRVDRYPKEWDQKPYLGQKGYVPHPRPRAGYAAMISELDEMAGKVVQLVDALGLARRTLILFSSDNGPTHDVGGVDTTFFDSSGGLRGRKGSVYEGGLRVPMIARWPGRVPTGATSGHVSAFQDVLPTLVELAGGKPPPGIDGISFLPTLLGRSGQRQHDHLTWEFFGYGGQQAVRRGRWKAVRRNLRRPRGKKAVALFDLETDPGERRDVSAGHPDIVQRLKAIMASDRTPSEVFPIPALDG